MKQSISTSLHLRSN